MPPKHIKGRGYFGPGSGLPFARRVTSRFWQSQQLADPATIQGSDPEMATEDGPGLMHGPGNATVGQHQS